MSEALLPVGETGESLRTVDRSARGLDEVVVISDGDNPDNIVQVTTSAPADDAPGLVVRVAESVRVETGLVTDAFKNLLVGSRYNTVEVHLDDANWTNYATTTLTSGGTVPQSAGSVIFTSGTNTNGRSRAVSLDNVVYRPMHEAYAAWTAAWIDGGLANSYQRIGWGDTAFVNGVFTTYEGAAFGLLYINNGVQTFVPQADWDDPCLGQDGSGYTLNGVAVAMDKTKKQVVVATAGLLGSLTLDIWFWSPDQNPVKVHTFARPNESAQAIFSNFDLPILCDVLKTGAGATSLRFSSACWAGGSTLDKIRISDPFTDRTLVSPGVVLIRGRTTAGGSGYVDVKVTPSGTLPTSNTSVGPTGTTVPAEATYLGVNSGGNLVALAQPLTDTQLRAAEVDTADSGEREYTHVVATVTASGDTTIHTPAAGMKVRLRWIYAINDPTASSAPLIKISLGASEKYRAWALSKRQKVTGPTDGALVVNLSSAGAVAVTALLEEVV